jgi:hypothetical protein
MRLWKARRRGRLGQETVRRGRGPRGDIKAARAGTLAWIKASKQGEAISPSSSRTDFQWRRHLPGSGKEREAGFLLDRSRQPKKARSQQIANTLFSRPRRSRREAGRSEDATGKGLLGRGTT